MTAYGASRQVETPEQRARNGVIAGLVAYFMWGVLPVYFKLVAEVTSMEVLAHRIVWAVPFGAMIIAARHQGPDDLEIYRSGGHGTRLFSPKPQVKKRIVEFAEKAVEPAAPAE